MLVLFKLAKIEKGNFEICTLLYFLISKLVNPICSWAVGCDVHFVFPAKHFPQLQRLAFNELYIIQKRRLEFWGSKIGKYLVGTFPKEVWKTKPFAPRFSHQLSKPDRNLSQFLSLKSIDEQILCWFIDFEALKF